MNHTAPFSPRTHRRTFLKQLSLGAAGVGLVWAAPEGSAAPGTVHRKLPRSTPEAEGVASSGIRDFLEAQARSRHEFHSFILVRHSRVVAEGYWAPYRPGSPQMMYSMSKSFTSTGIGLAVSEKRLTVDDSVISFFPEDLPDQVSEHLGALRVKHLLTMSVGHAQDSTGSIRSEENWVRKFLSLPIAHPPGTVFLYNSGATYMLSAIVQKVTGQKLIDYLQPRLFQPLGIDRISWETCPRGINTGGWGLKIQTEGLAKFGQMYLHHGEWKGRQILPAEWVAEATSFKIQQPSPDLERAKQQSDWHQGYCYQFWRCRHNGFRGDGAFGQYTIVLPEQDAVIAITSESANMQGELDLIWEHLLPAMQSNPLPAQQTEHAQLQRQLAGLVLQPPLGQISSPMAARISGKPFRVQTNDAGVQTVSLSFERGACVFTLKDQSGQYAVKCGYQRWLDGETAMPGTPPKLTPGPLGPVSKIAASAAWKDERTLEMSWRFYETPHHDTVTCQMEGDQIRVEYLDSLTAMNPGRKDKRPSLVGSLI